MIGNAVHIMRIATGEAEDDKRDPAKEHMRRGGLAAWKTRARAFKIEAHALFLACRDPRVPWYAKLLAGCVVAYALSPIDLIPDFIPILGYADDLVLVPLGVIVARRLIPPAILADCRARAAMPGARIPFSRGGALIIVTIWIGIAVAAGAWWFADRESK